MFTRDQIQRTYIRQFTFNFVAAVSCFTPFVKPLNSKSKLIITSFDIRDFYEADLKNRTSISNNSNNNQSSIHSWRVLFFSLLILLRAIATHEQYSKSKRTKHPSIVQCTHWKRTETQLIDCIINSDYFESVHTTFWEFEFDVLNSNQNRPISLLVLLLWASELFVAFFSGKLLYITNGFTWFVHISQVFATYKT